jgi:hypothetical protein
MRDIEHKDVIYSKPSSLNIFFSPYRFSGCGPTDIPDFSEYVNERMLYGSTCLVFDVMLALRTDPNAVGRQSRSAAPPQALFGQCERRLNAFNLRPVNGLR